MLNTRASAKMTPGRASCKGIFAVLLSGNYGRYAIHYCIAVSTFLGVNDQWYWRGMAWRGHCPASPFKMGATAAEVSFHKTIISNLIVYQDRTEIHFLKLSAHPENSEWFSTVSVIIFKVIIVAEQKQTMVTIFLYFIRVHWPRLFYCSHCPTAVPAFLGMTHRHKILQHKRRLQKRMLLCNFFFSYSVLVPSPFKTL